jgi:hypothetical protein
MTPGEEVLWQGEGARVVRDVEAVIYQYLQQPEGVWRQEYAPPPLLEEIERRSWGEPLAVDLETVLAAGFEVDRELGEYFGWWDYLPRKTGPAGSRSEWYARPPRKLSGKGNRQPAPVYSLTTSAALTDAIDGGHFVGVDGKVVHVRLATGQARTLAVPSSWMISAYLAHALALCIREARES